MATDVAARHSAVGSTGTRPPTRRPPSSSSPPPNLVQQQCRPASTGATIVLCMLEDTDEDLYLDLLERVLTRSGFPSYAMVRGDGWSEKLYAPVCNMLARANLQLVRRVDPQLREFGRDVPVDAETMVGHRRLRDLRLCIKTVVDDSVPGDLLEAGVWRGGVCIFMRGVLKALNCTDRTIWVADSFAGMPPTDKRVHPADAADKIGQWRPAAVGMDEVRTNFHRYGLLDDQVRFLKGWFKDTLPHAPIDKLAVLRLDADLYSSTTDILTALYDRVSVGGYIVVDDYSIATCRAAIDDFREQRGITDQVVDIDGAAARWRRTH